MFKSYTTCFGNSQFQLWSDTFYEKGTPSLRLNLRMILSGKRFMNDTVREVGGGEFYPENPIEKI